MDHEAIIREEFLKALPNLRFDFKSSSPAVNPELKDGFITARFGVQIPIVDEPESVVRERAKYAARQLAECLLQSARSN